MVAYNTGNVTATPTVYQGVVYVPDMGGQLWAVNAGSGKVRWSRSIARYTGIAGDVSRTSPATADQAIILGDGWIRNNVTAGAHVFAVDRRTGELIWLTRGHEHLAAIVTSSHIIHNGVAYVGISVAGCGRATWSSLTRDGQQFLRAVRRLPHSAPTGSGTRDTRFNRFRNT